MWTPSSKTNKPLSRGFCYRSKNETAVLALDPTYVDTFAEGIDESVWKIWGKTWDDYVKYDRGVIRADQVTTESGELVISMDKRDTPRTFKGDPDTLRDWDTGWVSNPGSSRFCSRRVRG